MRVLVVFAHPVETSFSAALHRTTVDALNSAGHEVDDCDLYAEDFQPVMSRQERLDYHNTAINTQPVQAYVDRLKAAEGLVFVHPVWNYGYPAIMKGFFDRVFITGVSFTLQNGDLKPNLWNIRRMAEKEKKQEAAAPAVPPREVVLLEEIRDLLAKRG